MSNLPQNSSQADKLARFVQAQKLWYPTVIQELTAGQKRSHWMWFIFPQLTKLGHSANAKYYGIDDFEEAKAYLSHPILGERLSACCQILLDLPSDDGVAIFGELDCLKLQSSMTLFDVVCADDIFADVLHKFFADERDGATLDEKSLPI